MFHVQYICNVIMVRAVDEMVSTVNGDISCFTGTFIGVSVMRKE